MPVSPVLPKSSLNYSLSPMSKRSLKLHLYCKSANHNKRRLHLSSAKVSQVPIQHTCRSSLILHLSILLANLYNRQHLYASLSLLTHLSLASFLWDIGKQCRPRSDTAERGVLSGSSLFAYRMFYQNFNKNENYHPTSLKTEMDWSNS